jgi:hypothetical protein
MQKADSTASGNTTTEMAHSSGEATTTTGKSMGYVNIINGTVQSGGVSSIIGELKKVLKKFTITKVDSNKNSTTLKLYNRNETSQTL